MSDQDLFDGNNQQPPATPDTSTNNDLFADKLQSIVNDKGEPKYKSVEDALEALNHSQNFIETLKTEKQQLEQNFQQMQLELEKRKSVEQVVEGLLEKDNPKPKDPEPPKTPDQGNVLDEGKVAELFEQMLSNKTKEQEKAENLRAVQTKLAEVYGDKARQAIANKAAELNTTPEKLGELAKENPVMALQLLSGVDVKSTTPTTSTQTPPHSQPKREISPPKRGLINGGASQQELLEELKQIREEVYQKYDVQT